MGDRANYVIVENRKLDLFYSHWGASTLAADMFWGPERTETFIRSNSPATEWLDDVFGEGGIAIDKDNRVLSYYLGHWPRGEGRALESAFDSILRDTWAASGFTTRPASTWAGFAAGVGVDPALVTRPPTPPHTIEVEALGGNLRQGSACCGWWSVKKSGEWLDHGVDFTIASVLMNGPALISALDPLAGPAQLRAAFVAWRADPAHDWASTLGDWFTEFCAVDGEEQTVRVSSSAFERDHRKADSTLAFLRDAWPGWTLELGKPGAADHFAYTGREMPTDLAPTPPVPEKAVELSFDQCAALIRETVDEMNSRKAHDAQGHAALLEQIRTQDGEPQWVNPHFLEETPSADPSAWERAKLAWRLLRRRLG